MVGFVHNLANMFHNLANMFHNSVIVQSLLRIRKTKYNFSSSGGILHLSAKLQ